MGNALNDMKDDILGRGMRRMKYEKEMKKLKGLTVFEFAQYMGLDKADTVFIYEWIEDYAENFCKEYREAVEKKFIIFSKN